MIMPCSSKSIVVIPLYNEVNTINLVLREVRLHTTADILVIDDGSDDGSTEKLSGIKGLTLITHSQNIGYGQSLIDGFQYAIKNKYDRLVTIDCDDQHEPQMVPTFFDALADTNILSGSRYLIDYPDNSSPPPDRKNINMKITDIINDITNFNLTDSFCGFKGYKVEALSKLSLTETGYGLPLQLWIQAWKAGLRVAERETKRIYSNIGRTFGGGLDIPEKRLEYYKQVIEKEING